VTSEHHRTGLRRRLVAASATALLLLGSLVPAFAADPEARKREVERQLAAAQHELAESGAALAQATTSFRDAEAQLPGAQAALAAAQAQHRAAQAHLAEVQGQLVAARAADKLAAEKLAAAEEEVRKALQRIAEVTARIDSHRSLMGQVAAQAYQQGSLGGLTDLVSVISSRSVEDFNSRVTYAQTAITSQDSIVNQLEDDRAVLANERVRLDGLRKEAQRLREEAAATLKRTEELEAQARAAEARAAAQRQGAADAQAAVTALIGQREQAVSAAKSAADQDAAEYAALERERQAIEAEIAERARQEQARIAAAQAAAAAAAAAEAERARQAAAAARGNSSSGGGSAPAAPVPAAPPAPAPSSGLSYPVSNPVITSPYGMRLHPVLLVRKLHDGTDFRAYCGTPIMAAASGQVVWARGRGGYGNQVLVDHGGMNGHSVMSSYSHLSRFAVGAGQHVSRGQVIGYSGTTGYSTACHLHFMVYVDGGVTNPMSWL